MNLLLTHVWYIIYIYIYIYIYCGCEVIPSMVGEPDVYTTLNECDFTAVVTILQHSEKRFYTGIKLSSS